MSSGSEGPTFGSFSQRVTHTDLGEFIDPPPDRDASGFYILDPRITYTVKTDSRLLSLCLSTFEDVFSPNSVSSESTLQSIIAQLASNLFVFRRVVGYSGRISAEIPASAKALEKLGGVDCTPRADSTVAVLEKSLEPEIRDPRGKRRAVKKAEEDAKRARPMQSSLNPHAARFVLSASLPTPIQPPAWETSHPGPMQLANPRLDRQAMYQAPMMPWTPQEYRPSPMPWYYPPGSPNVQAYQPNPYAIPPAYSPPSAYSTQSSHTIPYATITRRPFTWMAHLPYGPAPEFVHYHNPLSPPPSFPHGGDTACPSNANLHAAYQSQEPLQRAPPSDLLLPAISVTRASPRMPSGAPTTIGSRSRLQGPSHRDFTPLAGPVAGSAVSTGSFGSNKSWTGRLIPDFWMLVSPSSEMRPDVDLPPGLASTHVCTGIGEVNFGKPSANASTSQPAVSSSSAHVPVDSSAAPSNPAAPLVPTLGVGDAFDRQVDKLTTDALDQMVLYLSGANDACGTWLGFMLVNWGYTRAIHLDTSSVLEMVGSDSQANEGDDDPEDPSPSVIILEAPPAQLEYLRRFPTLHALRTPSDSAYPMRGLLTHRLIEGVQPNGLALTHPSREIAYSVPGLVTFANTIRTMVEIASPFQEGQPLCRVPRPPPESSFSEMVKYLISDGWSNSVTNKLLQKSIVAHRKDRPLTDAEVSDYERLNTGGMNAGGPGHGESGRGGSAGGSSGGGDRSRHNPSGGSRGRGGRSDGTQRRGHPAHLTGRGGYTYAASADNMAHLPATSTPPTFTPPRAVDRKFHAEHQPVSLPVDPEKSTPTKADSTTHEVTLSPVAAEHSSADSTEAMLDNVYLSEKQSKPDSNDCQHPRASPLPTNPTAFPDLTVKGFRPPVPAVRLSDPKLPTATDTVKDLKPLDPVGTMEDLKPHTHDVTVQELTPSTAPDPVGENVFLLFVCPTDMERLIRLRLSASFS